MNIPLKIKKGSGRINQALSLPSVPEKMAKIRQFKPIWLLFSVLIIILALTGLIMFVESRPFSPYQGLVPSEAVGTFYFDQARLNQVILQLQERNFNWGPFVSVQNEIAGLLAKNNANLDQFGSLLEKEVALVFLPCPEPPQKNAGQPGWLFLAKIKDQSGVSSLIEQAEVQFKRNYNLSAENYRQIRVVEVKALNQDQAGVFYAQAQNYLLISSNLAVLQGVIDELVGG